MGSQFSSLDGSLNKNQYLNRLVGEEHIDENDPFWNQLLSFVFNFQFNKDNSKLLDESIALVCQRFHQNNLKSGNYGSLVRVFCRRAIETRKMSDNQLMVLHTSNLLLIIRCFTKYIIEIENESALLDQLNARTLTDQNGEQFKSTDLSSSSSTSNSPKRTITTNSTPNNNRNRYMYDSSQIGDDSIDESEVDSVTAAAAAAAAVASSQDTEHRTSLLYLLIKSICQLCIEVPVENHTYYMHLEAINTLLTLLSVQMYTKVPTHESLIYQTFMLRMDRYVSEFVKTLLKNIVQQMPPPAFQSLSSYLQNADSTQQSTLISNLASGLWSVMTLGLAGSSSVKEVKGSDSSSEQKPLITYLPSLPSDHSTSGNGGVYLYDSAPIDCSARVLAWQSCHLLLVLVNHCTNESLYNPYRLALFHFTDTQDTPTNLPNSEPLPWFSIEFTKLFQMFTYTLHNDQYILLLYMLLHRNQHFKMFILSRLNIDLIVVPILKVIFTAPERNSHQIYMPLIILLILSEDDLFNKTIHSIIIKRLTWFTERLLSEISLGSLLILVVIRTIQFNMTRMRDKYLHTNCLAALANMSAKFSNLHPYVCQRINSLFQLLAKKRAKIIVALNTESNENITTTSQDGLSAVGGGQDLLQDLAIIEELMRMVLEIINSCLINSLHQNSDLVYSLLYHKSIYLQFEDHPTFQDVIENIEKVITSFSHDIENLEDKSVENLKSIIDIGIKQFHRDRFRKFSDLKFKYVEEDQPEEFFVPYVWSLIYRCSNLYWVDYSVKLFNSNNAIEGDATTANITPS